MATKKRFPANTSLEVDTFLNNKKIDGELYAFLQRYSYPDEEKRTIVLKKNLPVQKEICENIGVKSPKTLRSHLSYLIEAGYVVEETEQYILPSQEEIFFMIPLDTLQFINDNLKEHVIKTYIYLGQRWKYKGAGYLFTIKEVGQHLGIKMENNHVRDYTKINNALKCLQRLGLLNWTEIYVENEEGVKVPYKKLTKFSFECP